MQKQRIETKEIKIVEAYCDICGDPAKGRCCRICHRDICSKHAYNHRDEWGGDGSTKYCTECWKVGEQFRRRKSVLSEIYEQEIDDLEKAWEKKALEQVANNFQKKISKS